MKKERRDTWEKLGGVDMERLGWKKGKGNYKLILIKIKCVTHLFLHWLLSYTLLYLSMRNIQASEARYYVIVGEGDIEDIICDELSCEKQEH